MNVDQMCQRIGEMEREIAGLEGEKRALVASLGLETSPSPAEIQRKIAGLEKQIVALDREVEKLNRCLESEYAEVQEAMAG
jgi:phage host-nuclease inhibitor protein Gam